MQARTHCLVCQDVKIHLRSGAILSAHITSYTFASLVNTDYLWVSLNTQEQSRRNKVSLKDKASQLRASEEPMTGLKLSSQSPFSNYKIHGRNKGSYSGPASTTHIPMHWRALLPLLSAGQEQRIIPEMRFAMNLLPRLSWVLRTGKLEQLAEKWARGGC